MGSAGLADLAQLLFGPTLQLVGLVEQAIGCSQSLLCGTIHATGDLVLFDRLEGGGRANDQQRLLRVQAPGGERGHLLLEILQRVLDLFSGQCLRGWRLDLGAAGEELVDERHAISGALIQAV